ncbi:hypothetical protein FOXB_05404, partial [Fusarium oxysporum f. sp. conglutinans Fo5176]
IQPIKALF